MDIQDLGTLDHNLVLFGGVYSNYQALTALLDWSQSQGFGADQMICTGDIVAYCADAAVSVEAMQRSNIATIAGNCEKQLAARAQDCGCGFETGSVCDVLSVGWFSHADNTLDDAARQYIGTLPDWITFRHFGKKYVAVHGGASRVNAFLWPIQSDNDLLNEINVVRAKIGAVDGVICGHSGIAFSRMVDGVHWINAGAIGLPPHDGRTLTRFATLANGHVKHNRLEYDFERARGAMINAGLTQGYHETLVSGVWPSEDVLPPELRR